MSRTLPKNSYQDLARLYAEVGDGQGLGHLRRPPRSGWRRFTMASFFLLAAASAASWIGFTYWPSGIGEGTAGLKLSIEGPEAVAVTEPVVYRIVLVSTAKETVRDISLRLNYPEGFVWQSATLTPGAAWHNTWSFSSLDPGERKEIDVNGLVLGEAGSIRTAAGVATYHLANFRSELEASASSALKLTDPPIRLAWSGPSSVTPGSTATYTLTYEHLGSTELGPSTLTVALPVNFTLTAATPPPITPDTYQWPVGALLPKATGTVTVTGTWAKEASGDETLGAAIAAPSDTKENYTIVKTAFTTRLATGDVVVSLTVNGQTAPPATNIGEELAYELQYRNNGANPIAEVEVRVRYDASVIDWAKVSLEDGGRVEGTVLVWRSAEVPALARILPGASGTLRWRIPLLASWPQGAVSLAIVATPSFEHRRVGDEVADRTYDGPAVTVVVNGTVDVSAVARYFDEQNRAVGSGPLPPRVGTPTTYQITWQVKNAEHRLTNVNVSAIVAAGAVVSGEVKPDVGRFDSSDARHPAWLMADLAPGLEPSLTFPLTFTPPDADAGKVVVLAEPLSITATDAVTGGTVTGRGNAVTTNLETDPVARGQGLVTP